MTRLLELALEKAKMLADDQQDAIGYMILREVEGQHSHYLTSESPPKSVVSGGDTAEECSRIEKRDGIPTIITPPGTAKFTLEDVAAALDEA